MKTAKPKVNKKIIVISAIVVILAVAVGISALYFVHRQKPAVTDKDTTNLSLPTSGETKAGQNIKKAAIDNTSSNNNATIGVSLHGAQNNDQVVFDTVIQSVTNDGECTLTITSNNQTITKTSTIFANPSSSSCRGFAVSVSLLPKGTWVATLSVNIGSSKGISSANISVE